MADKRKTDWIDTFDTNFLGGAGAQRVFALLGSRAAEDLAGCTGVRLLVHLEASFSTASPNDSVQRLSYGIGMGSREAVTASIVPDPEDMSEFPPRGWLLRDFMVCVQDNVNQRGPWVARYDLRAGRKLDEGMMYMIVTNTDISGSTESLQVQVLVRLLCLLP